MNLTIFIAILTTTAAYAQAPEIRSWILNPTGATGYNGIPSNVQEVRYSDRNVYVSCTCIPGYDIGPWAGNPNTPANQNFVFRITRSPQKNASTPTATPRGHIGVWTNGVSIFNATDARSYNNQGTWNQNAVVVEGPSFDTCLGHPAPNGEYHHHLNPRCLYDDRDDSRHSPIIGYAFDGYPIYGAYGFRTPDGAGGIARMRSSYRLRDMTERTTRPDGGILPQAQYGPPVSTTYPLGYYCEDFEYIAGLGDLDEHNGRFCVTPEYPNGTYAYFVTLDENGEAAYPYTLGTTYYGVVPAGNTGPQSGHHTPDEPVQSFTGTLGIADGSTVEWSAQPNPASDDLTLRLPETAGGWRVSIHDLMGRAALRLPDVRERLVAVSLVGLNAGLYVIRLESSTAVLTSRLVVLR